MGTFSSGNCVWEWNVRQQKKEMKRKETEEQAPMRDYREALVADMKAIGKFCLCYSNIASIQMVSVFLFKNQDVQEY